MCCDRASQSTSFTRIQRSTTKGGYPNWVLTFCCASMQKTKHPSGERVLLRQTRRQNVLPADDVSTGHIRSPSSETPVRPWRRWEETIPINESLLVTRRKRRRPPCWKSLPVPPGAFGCGPQGSLSRAMPDIKNTCYPNWISGGTSAFSNDAPPSAKMT